MNFLFFFEKKKNQITNPIYCYGWLCVSNFDIFYSGTIKKSIYLD